MFFIFDTETTGFYKANASHDDPTQGRVMQIAWLLLDDKFNEVSSFKSPIQIPEWVFVNESAQAVHGLSREFVNKYGSVMTDVLKMFHTNTYRADLVICHNTAFDLNIMDVESQNYGVLASLRQPPYCTMKAMTNLCKLPHKNGKKSMFGQEFKWPTLQEAHAFCFGVGFDGAHDALADVRATSRIFKWLCENGHVQYVDIINSKTKEVLHTEQVPASEASV